MKSKTASTIIIIILVLFLAVSCFNEQILSGSEEATSTVPTSIMRTPQPTNIPSNTPYLIPTPIPTVVEPGLASGYPCKPPCWWGLTPGQSTGQEAEQAMERLRTNGWANYINGNPTWGYSIYPLPSTARGSIEVIIDNNTVKIIKGDIMFDYPISMVIEQFGPPEGVRSLQDFTRCSSCDGWKPSTEFAWTILVYLLYPEQGLLFWGWVHPSGAGCLCPEMKMHEFCYYESLSMSEALSDNHLSDVCLPALEGITEEDLVEWHSFGGGY
jgi:hypothetical protein